MSTNSHILYRKVSSCSTFCFCSAAIDFLLVEPDGDLLFPLLGILFDGVVNRENPDIGPDCDGSGGRYDGLVFLIDVSGLTCGGEDITGAAVSLENGLSAAMTSSVLITRLILQAIFAA